MTFYDEADKRRSLLTGAAAAFTSLALIAALAHNGLSRGVPLAPGSTAFSQAVAAGPQSCKQWSETHVLGGGCLAELDRSITTVPCCGGAGYRCKPCQAAKLDALRCVSPRHTLLRAARGCSIASNRQDLSTSSSSGSSGSCLQVSADTVAAGEWLAPPPGSPSSLPSLVYQLGGEQDSALMEPAQALQQLWAAGIDRVVVSGDSTVRHFYNRLIGLLRQQPIIIDGGGIAHAHYRLQSWPGVAAPGGDSGGASSGGGASAGGFATDTFWVSPAANFIKGDWDTSLMEEGLGQLMNRSFGPPPPQYHGGTAAGTESSSGTGSSGGDGDSSDSSAGRTLTVDFLVGAKADWQIPHVRRYFAAGDGGEGWQRRTLLVLSLCIWEQKRVFRSNWPDFVEDLRQHLGQVVLLTCPTDRLQREERAEGRKLVAERNDILRKMVAAGRGGSADPKEVPPLGNSNGERRGEYTAGAPLLLVDLDAITQRVPQGIELGIAPRDFHYQCMLTSSTTYNDTGPIEWASGDGRPHPQYPVMRYDRLLIPPVGTCSDPVNYAGWQLLLRMLCAGSHN